MSVYYGMTYELCDQDKIGHSMKSRSVNPAPSRKLVPAMSTIENLTSYVCSAGQSNWISRSSQTTNIKLPFSMYQHDVCFRGEGALPTIL